MYETTTVRHNRRSRFFDEGRSCIYLFGVLAIMLVSVPSFASGGEKNAGQTLGTPNSFIADILGQQARSGASISLPTPSRTELEVELDFYSYENGHLVLGGQVHGIENSELVMKGNAERIYGWVYFIDSGVVYKYSMNSEGLVFVHPAKVSDIYSVDYSVTPNDGYVPTPPKYSRQELPPVPHVGPIPDGVNLNDLQSKPDSSKILWMDIRDLMTGDEPSSCSRSDMWEMWQIQAAGLSMFDVNVTTSKALYDATSASNRGFHTHDDDATGRSYCCVSCFGTNRGCMVYRKPGGGYDSGRSALHESGHLFGVLDYGTNAEGPGSYFTGFPEYKWVPIMGNFWAGNAWGTDALFQWSKGEYQDANQDDDFFAVASYSIDLKDDDIPDSQPLIINSETVSMVDNYGLINAMQMGYDDDDFTFAIGEDGGEIDITVDRIENIAGAMLDVYAAVLDETGNIVVEDNPQAARHATLQTQLDAGEYTLRVSGAAEGTPFIGFSTYGSIGYYGIYGTIINADDGDTEDDDTDTGSTDEDTDTDDTDSDSDSGGDSDTDSDSDGDADGDSDGDADGDSDGDADGDSDGDADDDDDNNDDDNNDDDNNDNDNDDDDNNDNDDDDDDDDNDDNDDETSNSGCGCGVVGTLDRQGSLIELFFDL